ncbi:uncharacterized protein [Macrobrachium rosenbergii]|uniref:uncharacterized protein n=1 Tax=Macrobrachium rosenbergii TaxID=79674 RepID=UPI0034D5DF0E
MSKELRDGMASHGIKHFHSMPYHPESQGIIERFRQSLSTTIKKLEQEGGGLWVDNLPYALFAARHTPSWNPGYSLFELLYAHSTWAPLDKLYDAWADPAHADWAEELPTIQKNLRAAWAVAQATEAATQEQVKMKFDGTTRSCSFERSGPCTPDGCHEVPQNLLLGPPQNLGKAWGLELPSRLRKRGPKWLHINLLKPCQTHSEETPEDDTSTPEVVVGIAALKSLRIWKSSPQVSLPPTGKISASY